MGISLGIGAEVLFGAEAAALPEEIGLGVAAADIGAGAAVGGDLAAAAGLGDIGAGAAALDFGTFGAGAADLTTGAFAADAGITGATAAGTGAETFGALSGLDAFAPAVQGAADLSALGAAAEFGAAGAGTAALDASAGAGFLGGAFGPGASSIPAADFSAFGTGGATGASSSAAPDVGAFSAVPKTPGIGATGGGGFSTPVSAVPSSGGVVSPTTALDIGNQDVLTAAKGDLLQPDRTDLFANDFGANFSPSSTDASAGLGDRLGPMANIDTGTSGAATASAPAAASASPALPPATAPAATAPAAAAAQSPAAAGGGSNWLWKAAQLGLGAAPLAFTLAKGETPLPPQAQQVQSQIQPTLAAQQAQLQNITQGVQPLQNLAQTDLGLVANNQLTASQAAGIEQQRQNLMNQWRQVLFNQGVQDPSKDTRWPQIQAQVEQQMQQQTQQMIQTTLQTALGASNQANATLLAASGQSMTASQQASANLLQIANLQVQQDTAFTNAISGATRALGTVAALSAFSGKAA